MPCGNKAESAKAYSSCPRLMCRSFGNGSGNGEYAGEGSCVGDCGGKSPLLIRSYTCYRWKVVAPPRFAARRIVPLRSTPHCPAALRNVPQRNEFIYGTG